MLIEAFLAAALTQTPQGALPLSEFVVIEARSRDKTLAATLYLPSSFHRREKETLAYISLTNKSSSERLVINGMWSHTNLFPNRLDGPPLLKPMVITFEGPLPKRAQTSISPGHALFKSFPLQHVWDFIYTDESRYKLELVYDDTGLWPPNEARNTVGRIKFRFDLIVEPSIVRFELPRPT